MATLSRKRAAVLGVIAIVLLTGCLNMTVEVDVGDDGSLEEMYTEIDMNQLLYDSLQTQAQQDGYESVGESLLDDADEDAWSNIQYDQTETDDGVVIEITASDGDPSAVDGLSVSVEDGQVTFTDSDGFQGFAGEGQDLSEFEEQIEMEYVVNMPGPVSDSNGNVEGDSTVRWTLAEHRGVGSFEATSDIEESSDGSPGFGLVPGLVALALGGASLTVYRFGNH